jgi:YHS domain-containing protein
MKVKLSDPVCGKVVNPKKVKFRYKFGTQTYSFCTLGCLLSFDDKRDEFVSQIDEDKGT